MRRALLALLRATQLIQFADGFVRQRAVQAHAEENARYRTLHPERVFPDPALVFEVAGHARLESYDLSGARDAEGIAALLRQAGAPADARILDWGCGPGRVLAHLPALLPQARFTGCDPSAPAIAAAQAELRDIDLCNIGPLPPAPFADASFDAIYGVSVLTHLPEDAAAAWIAELARLIADTGVVLVSTHGARAAQGLGGRERECFDAGDYVMLSGACAGSRTYAAYMSEACARTMFRRAFADVTVLPAPPGDFVQDIWLLRAPRRVRGA